MKSIRLFVVFATLAFGAIAAPAMAANNPDDGITCTSNPSDGSGLPECFTPDDNECYKGGVLYREENQDGCASLWYWKAGWFLARFNDGKISRSNFPVEFKSVLPPEAKAPSLVCLDPNPGTKWKDCLLGNQYFGDNPADGPGWNYVGVIIPPTASCPAGTTFQNKVMNVQSDFKNFIVANGFALTDIVCFTVV
jgi:hypothetical protein